MRLPALAELLADDFKQTGEEETELVAEELRMSWNTRDMAYLLTLLMDEAGMPEEQQRLEAVRRLALTSSATRGNKPVLRLLRAARRKEQLVKMVIDLFPLRLRESFVWRQGRDMVIVKAQLKAWSKAELVQSVEDLLAASHMYGPKRRRRQRRELVQWLESQSWVPVPLRPSSPDPAIADAEEGEDSTDSAEGTAGGPGQAEAMDGEQLAMLLGLALRSSVEELAEALLRVFPPPLESDGPTDDFPHPEDLDEELGPGAQDFEEAIAELTQHGDDVDTAQVWRLLESAAAAGHADALMCAGALLLFRSDFAAPCRAAATTATTSSATPAVIAPEAAATAEEFGTADSGLDAQSSSLTAAGCNAVGGAMLVRHAAAAGSLDGQSLLGLLAIVAPPDFTAALVAEGDAAHAAKSARTKEAVRLWRKATEGRVRTKQEARREMQEGIMGGSTIAHMALGYRCQRIALPFVPWVPSDNQYLIAPGASRFACVRSRGQNGDM